MGPGTVHPALFQDPHPESRFMLRRFFPARDLAPLVVAGLLALAWGCGGAEGPDERGGAERAAPSSPDAATVEGEEPAGNGGTTDASGLPPGGLETWVDEMRARLEEIELDPRRSYRDVVALYTTHHGAIERTFGQGGTVTGDAHPALADAVQRQDSAFHELMELTGTTDYIERTHLLHAIRNVRLAMESILDRARAAGVPLNPRSTGPLDPRATGSRSAPPDG